MDKGDTVSVKQLSDAHAWLRKQAVGAVEASRITHTKLGKVMHLVQPHGTGHYQAMFLRDFVYKIVAMPELFSDSGTEEALEMFLRCASCSTWWRFSNRKECGNASTPTATARKRTIRSH